jgi:hypothetical protein
MQTPSIVTHARDNCGQKWDWIDRLIGLEIAVDIRISMLWRQNK